MTAGQAMAGGLAGFVVTVAVVAILVWTGATSAPAPRQIDVVRECRALCAPRPVRWADLESAKCQCLPGEDEPR